MLSETVKYSSHSYYSLFYLASDMNDRPKRMFRSSPCVYFIKSACYFVFLFTALGLLLIHFRRFRFFPRWMAEGMEIYIQHVISFIHNSLLDFFRFWFFFINYSVCRKTFVLLLLLSSHSSDIHFFFFYYYWIFTTLIFVLHTVYIFDSNVIIIIADEEHIFC